MKKILACFFVMIISLFFYGCQQNITTPNPMNEKIDNPKKKGSETEQADIFDFKHIDKVPETNEKQPIDNVIKVFFDESTFEKPYEAVAIDIENNEVYANPIIGQRGLRAQDGIVEINNAENVLDILEQYEVQMWDKEYSPEQTDANEDGYSWQLLLQYVDGTVEKHEGTEEDEVPPEFNDVAEKLRDFADDRLEDH